MALLEFLRINGNAVQARAGQKFLHLTGERRASELSKSGVPIFIKQLLHVLQHSPADIGDVQVDSERMVTAADRADEPAIAAASGRAYDGEVAKSAGAYGKELQHLGYTLSHVVHTYGSVCQAITELAILKDAAITTEEFRALNRCLDAAVAGAVTAFHAERTKSDADREIQHLGFLAHELRNALGIINTSLRLIKSGTVGFGGSVGIVLDRALKRQKELIDRSLAEVRLRVDPQMHKEIASVSQLIDEVITGSEPEAALKNQALKSEVEDGLQVNADQYLLYSAVSNLVQNAVKYTRPSGTITISAYREGERTIVAIADQCGGLNLANPNDLIKPFEQRHPNRTGLGLGLTIAQRAVELNGGTLEIVDRPGVGCTFKISLPGTTLET